MSERQFKEYQKKIEAFGKRLEKSPTLRRELLIEFNIITSKGDFTKRYKDLYMKPVNAC